MLYLGQEILTKPTVDSIEARCSRGVGHAFAEDPAIIRLRQVQARCESVEPFPRVSAEGLDDIADSRRTDYEIEKGRNRDEPRPTLRCASGVG